VGEVKRSRGYSICGMIITVFDSSNATDCFSAIRRIAMMEIAGSEVKRRRRVISY
jgi:hypothetical protein